jgi:hypothetical protein
MDFVFFGVHVACGRYPKTLIPKFRMVQGARRVRGACARDDETFVKRVET